MVGDVRQLACNDGRQVKAALILAILLAGCASFEGVQMNADEAKACKAEGCAVFTDHELLDLARKFFNEGYQAGKKWL
jgi:hypothetical protein